jgi:hypothetical protein
MNWQPVATVVCTLLSIGALFWNSAINRKHARQLELRKTDPNAPMVPPPSRAHKFLKDYWVFVAVEAFNVVVLIYRVLTTNTLTVSRVVTISMLVAAIFTIGGMQFVIWLSSEALQNERQMKNDLHQAVMKLMQVTNDRIRDLEKKVY